MARFRIISSSDELNYLFPLWSNLYQRAGQTPFAAPDVLFAWWHRIGQAMGASWCVVAEEKAGRLLALYPFVVYRKKGIRVLRWAGHDSSCGWVGLRDEGADSAALWQFLIDQGPFDMAELPNLEGASTDCTALSGMRNACLGPQATRYVLKTEGLSGQELGAKHAASFRNARHKRNRMMRAGTYGFIAERPSVVPYDFLAEVKRHKISWCARTGHKSPIYETPNFLEELCAAAASRNELVVAHVSINQQRAGFFLCFAARDILYGHTITYDPAFSAFSPGMVGRMETILWAADNGFSALDQMEGGEPFKQNGPVSPIKIRTVYLWRGVRRGGFAFLPCLPEADGSCSFALQIIA